MKKKVNENLISLKIIKDLDKFNLYFTKKYSKINLVSVFFLEIQKYLSCAIKNIHFKTYSKNQQIILPFFDYNYLIKSQKLIYKKGNWTDYKINLSKSFIIYKISNIVNSIKKNRIWNFSVK